MLPKISLTIFYQKYMDILNNQIQIDLKYFENEYKVLDNVQNDQRTIIKDNILKGVEKGLNYSMRQTQNFQESQVTVVDDVGFERKIPQDFLDLINITVDAYWLFFYFISILHLRFFFFFVLLFDMLIHPILNWNQKRINTIITF